MNLRKKILLVQLYSNGDCLFATAVARQVKQDFPNAHLTWAIAAFCKNVIANNPFIDDTLVVDIKKNDVAAFRRLRKKLLTQKAAGIYDEVFITHNTDTNLAYYDGTIRGGILKAYPYPITVPLTPVLRLTGGEAAKAELFAATHRLSGYRNVVLFECAPLSGQLKITKEIAIYIAEQIVRTPDTSIILSSAHRVEHANAAIIDGSSLTLRETAGLTHHCSLLLGCSSGITWITTSTAAKLLPMVQVIDAGTTWVNPISRDFARTNLPVEKVIELTDFNPDRVAECVTAALADFAAARARYNQEIPLHFRTTRAIVYNLLCYLEFAAIAKHVQVTRKVYGDQPAFYRQLLLGFISFPFTLLKNIWEKKIVKTR